MMFHRGSVLALLLIGSLAHGDGPPASTIELATRPFVYGREYFVLRSGRAELVLQSDRVDLGPGLTYLLFDAQNARQSGRKNGAFNFDPVSGFADSALRVKLGDHDFTALGHRLTTGWTTVDGIPAVEAQWWAGGIRVTELWFALAEGGAFERFIRLEGANLVGPEEVTLLLSLPPGETQLDGRVLVQSRQSVSLALGVGPGVGVAHSQGGLAIGPINVAPGAVAEIHTFLAMDVSASQRDAFVARIARLADAAAQDERQATAGRWSTRSTISTADATVQALYDHARYGLPGMIAEDGTINAGIFEYGGQWVRDTSNTVLGALHAGEFELATQTLERVLTKMITAQGVTMIAGGFDAPDREQFDQMGELLHVLKAYRDWTGDDRLIREHRDLLRTLIERPLRPEFRDATGMVHNRREFWERTFDDAYELIYQAYVVQGLRDAADLAPALGAEDQAERWRAEAARTLEAMLAHPKCALVDAGRLIKRRNVDGRIADLDPKLPRGAPDAPSATEAHHRLFPDASVAQVIALGVVDAKSALARDTLEGLEPLWNTRWSDGGYDRYHTSSQLDQPGPWTFATSFILRAQHDAGLYARSRRSLEWLNTVQGGRVGAWFEEIPSLRSTAEACGVLPWTSAEVTLFVVRHWLGIHFEGDRLVVAPALYPESPPVAANLRFRQARLQFKVDGAGPMRAARVNGQDISPDAAGRLVLPPTFVGGTIEIQAGK